MRTYTSQVSQLRSSEMECMGIVGRSPFASRLLRASSRELRATLLSPCPLVARSSPLAAFSYPASFEIMANSGMYSEMTMPPMVTPRQPMMAGSSMANMSLVAASTSSS